MKKIFTYIYTFFLTGIFMINAYASEITMPTSPVKDIIGYYDANRYNSYIYQVPVGTTVYSICDGTVTLAKRQPGFGNCITIQKGNGISFTYCHLKDIFVKEGDFVYFQQEIGLSGNTGMADRAGELALYAQDKDGNYITNKMPMEEFVSSQNSLKNDVETKENPFVLFTKKKNIEIQSTNSLHGQFSYQVSGITVDELAKELRYRVVKKIDKDHQHDWMYFDVTDEEGGNKLFRYCQTCERWQVFEAE